MTHPPIGSATRFDPLVNVELSRARHSAAWALIQVTASRGSDCSDLAELRVALVGGEID